MKNPSSRLREITVLAALSSQTSHLPITILGPMGSKDKHPRFLE